MRRVAVAGLLVLASAGLAGCLGSNDASSDPVSSSSTTDNESVTSFELEENVTVGFTAVVGAQGEWVGAWPISVCPQQNFLVPLNATETTITVSGSVVNASRPGAGSAYVTVETPDETIGKEQGSGESVAFSFENPAQGQWKVQIGPQGAAVEQRWTLTVGLQGESGENERLSLSDAC